MARAVKTVIWRWMLRKSSRGLYVCDVREVGYSDMYYRGLSCFLLFLELR